MTLFPNAKCPGSPPTSKVDEIWWTETCLLKIVCDLANADYVGFPPPSILTLYLNTRWMAAKFVPFLLTDEWK